MRRVRRYRKRALRSRRTRRGIFRRRRRYRRRSGSLSCKLTNVTQAAVPISTTLVEGLSFKLTDFKEFNGLYKNFERVKVNRMRVTVYPQQNVTDNQMGLCGGYCLLPWHRSDYASGLSFSDYLSSDKAKYFRSTQIGKQSYVPAIHVVNESGTAAVSADVIKWRPEIYINGLQKEVPMFYGGLFVHEPIPPIAQDSHAYYTFKMEVWVTFKNQTVISS